MDLLPILTLSLTTIVAALLYALRRLLTPLVPVKGKTNIPGPTEGITWPIVGDALWYAGIQNMTDFWKVTDRILSMRPKLMSFCMGQRLMIFVNDAETLEALMNSNRCHTKEANLYLIWNKFSDGVLSREGKRWSNLRRPLDRQMHPKFMNNHIEVIAAKATALCDDVGRVKGTIDLKAMLKYCTLEIFLEAVLGISTTELTNDLHGVPVKIDRMVDGLFKRLMKIQYWSDWFYNISPEGREEKKLKEEFRLLCREIIEKRYKSYEENGLDPEDPDFEPQNYLDTVLQVGRLEKMDEKELDLSFGDIVVAGYDTTGLTMCSVILHLAMHPEYQEKVYQEQLAVTRGGLEAPTQEEMSRMNFLSMVINETLRHMTVPLGARTLSSQIEIDGNIFPEGASIIFSLYYIHRDPKHWAKPNEFYPDHFLPEDVAKRPKGAFLPFGFGTRMCAGKLFALYEMKVILSMLIRRYRFSTNLKFDEMTYKFILMVEPVEGFPVEVIRRVAAA